MNYYKRTQITEKTTDIFKLYLTTMKLIGSKCRRRNCGKCHRFEILFQRRRTIYNENECPKWTGISKFWINSSGCGHNSTDQRGLRPSRRNSQHKENVPFPRHGFRLMQLSQTLNRLIVKLEPYIYFFHLSLQEIVVQ